jgi:hypothetical protein
MEEKPKPKGRPIAIDLDAVSGDPAKPAFIARPPGAPVYYGFPILADLCVEGFTLGMITDFEAQPCEYGDGFVVAPDDSRCGLVWEVSTGDYFQSVSAPEPDRWGVWGVAFPFPMDSRENARRNLEHIVPHLKKEWRHWLEQKQAP